jgi:hypothetical protein
LRNRRLQLIQLAIAKDLPPTAFQLLIGRGGGAPLTLRATRGDIRLRKPEGK